LLFGLLFSVCVQHSRAAHQMLGYAIVWCC
jgi:hypothetical protein